MAIVRSDRAVSAGRLRTLASRLLDASRLCAIATTSPTGGAHVNTAYFAWGPGCEIVWLSDPASGHSRNLRRRPSAAITVYDSRQRWAEPDRGIQLFGSARELRGRDAEAAERTYALRFPAYEHGEHAEFRFYRLRPRRVKLFDETALGGGVFVTATVRGGALAWERTETIVGSRKHAPARS